MSTEEATREKGKGDKGAGKGGFKGTCYKCGKQGHRAADCRTRVDMVDEYEDEDECEMQLAGGVWTIGQIEVQKNRSWQAGNRAAIAIDDKDEIPVIAVEHVLRTRDERECDRVQRRGSEEASGHQP